MIYVDTREQLPLWQRGIEWKKLDVGDYTTDRLYQRFHIERKSGSDLYGSIIQGHRRFRTESIRAELMGIRLAVYVECTFDDFVDLKFTSRKLGMNPETLRKIMNSILFRWLPTEFKFCKSRECMKREIKARLLYEESKLKPRRK